MAERTLEFTPTWAVATVCTVFVAFSLLLVFAIDKLEDNLKGAQRKHLVKALDKMKEELMLLGFISLLLTVFQSNIASICVDKSLLDRWTPCAVKTSKVDETSAKTPEIGRRLLKHDVWPAMDWGNEPLFRGRILAGGGDKPVECKVEGQEPLLSTEGLAQLHIFIFVLACVHIVYSLLAMVLASLKVKGWKGWEDEAHSSTHDNLAEITRALTLHHQNTFAKYHTSKPWSKNRFLVWIVCFFRQFGQSVTRADYLTLRMGFIANHNTRKTFDFHSYMLRSLEDEFQKIVGISLGLWIFVVLFLLFNIDGVNLYFWLALLPVVVVLLVGMKLQHIIATLALEKAGITQGGHFAGRQLKPRDELFWFSRPQLVLSLIHFVLFQNAFEMTTFIWFWWQFGLSSCLLKNKTYVYVRVGLGVFVQFLCSYSTLPLYAIVTQMGSHYKQAIFQHHIKDKIDKWRQGAKKRAKLGAASQEDMSPSGSGSGSHDGFAGDGSFEDDSSHEHGNRVRVVNDAERSHVHDIRLPTLGRSKTEIQMEKRPYSPRPWSPYSEKKYYKQVSTIQPETVPPRLAPVGGESFQFRP